MRLAIFAALAAVFVTAGPSWAAEPSPRQRELASRYVRAMHMPKLMDDLVEAMKPTMIAEMSDVPNLTPDMKARLQTVVIDTVTETSRELADKMTPEMESLIAEEFTEEELSQAVAFYESATGQSILAKTPTLMGKLMPKMMPLMRDMRVKMEQRILEKLCPGGECSAPPSKAAA